MARITGPRASRGVQMTFKKVNEFTDAVSWYNEFTDTESCYNESTDAESCYDVNSPADDGASSDAEMVDVGNEPATTEWQRVDKPAASKRQRVTISCAAYDSSATETQLPGRSDLQRRRGSKHRARPARYSEQQRPRTRFHPAARNTSNDEPDPPIQVISISACVKYEESARVSRRSRRRRHPERLLELLVDIELRPARHSQVVYRGFSRREEALLGLHPGSLLVRVC